MRGNVYDICHKNGNDQYCNVEYNKNGGSHFELLKRIVTSIRITMNHVVNQMCYNLFHCQNQMLHYNDYVYSN